MKKISLIILIISLSFILTGCDLLTQMQCQHEYETISETPPTCSKKGERIDKCLLCEKTKKTVYSLLDHQFVSQTFDASCQEEGYVLKICSVCGFEKKEVLGKKLPHRYSDWVVVQESTDFKDGLRRRTCSTCGFIEEEKIIANNYIDKSLVVEKFNSSITYECDTYEDLVFRFNSAIINVSKKLSCNINFEYESFQTLVDQLLEDCEIPFNLKLNASKQGNHLELTFSYEITPSVSTSKVTYTQHDSLNYQKYVSTRDANFDDFKINYCDNGIQVSYSEQLYFVLEKGVRPNCVSGSSAEKIYNEAKRILREIVDDRMSDAQKAKAIHDYLVMNVVYDGELLQLNEYNASNLKGYNGYYLEGVFFDKKAVCEGISKAFTVMCNIEGIPCVTVEGIQTKNPNGVGHAWNKVYIDDSWYIVDATSDGTIINNSYEVLSYEFLFTNTSIFRENYTGETFTNLICDKTLNPYQLSEYEFDGIKADFYIESQDELNHIVNYFYNSSKNNYTIEFKFGFDTGSSSKDELEKAYKANSIYSSFSYIDNGDCFMLINND